MQPATAHREGLSGEAAVFHQSQNLFLVVVVLVLVALVVVIVVVVVFVVVILFFVIVIVMFDLKLRVSGNLVVVRFPADEVEVPGEVIVAAVHRNEAAAEIGHRVPLQFDNAFQSIFRRSLGDAGRDRVDHSAHRAAAIQQRRRAAENLDLPGDLRIDAHRVIHTHRGDIHGIEAVLHGPHARARESANDRPGGSRGEIGRTDAELAGERLTQVGADDSFECLFAND